MSAAAQEAFVRKYSGFLNQEQEILHRNQTALATLAELLVWVTDHPQVPDAREQIRAVIHEHTAPADTPFLVHAES